MVSQRWSAPELPSADMELQHMPTLKQTLGGKVWKSGISPLSLRYDWIMPLDSLPCGGCVRMANNTGMPPS